MKNRTIRALLSALAITAMVGNAPLSAFATEAVGDNQVEEVVVEAAEEADEEELEDVEIVEVETEAEAISEAVEDVVDTGDEVSEAVEEEAAEDESFLDDEEAPVYVLMNIPYSEFYEAEGTSDVDAMSSATMSKTRSYLAAGSYHVNSDGTDITGVVYPVKVSDASALEGLRQVTDEDSLDITVSLRGQSTTTTYAGRDALFESASYSYYVLSEEPAYYKELTVNEDGSFTFGEATGEYSEKSVYAELFTGTETTYGDYQINIDDYSPGTVYGVVLNTVEGGHYGLKHVENIWLDTALSISTGHLTETHGCPLQVYEGAEGQTVSSITYYTSEGIEELILAESLYLAPIFDDLSAESVDGKTIDVEGLPEDIEDAKATVTYRIGEGRGAQTVTVAEAVDIVDGKIALETALEDGVTYTVQVTSSNYGTSSASFEYAIEYVYVLMNIPYSEFYDAEGTSDVDAMSSATKSKTRSSLAAGSYHVNSDGTDITGIIYPVRLSDTSALEDLRQVTDEDSFDITVSLRGQETTTTYAGKDALFESASYSYYVLSEEPAYYKDLTVNEDGSFTFGEATGTTSEKTVEAELLTGTETTYGDYQINVFDYEPGTVYGVVLNTAEGGHYGLKHVENIWRNTDLAISTGHLTETHGCPLQVYEGAEGQTVTSITYYTSEGIEELTLVEGLYLAPIIDDLSAVSVDGKTVDVTGLPEDIKDAKATVTYRVGEGRTAQTITIANAVDIANGKITLDEVLEDGVTYTVQVTSSNYGTSSYSFAYVDTEALRTAIATAESLSKADYTVSTWNSMQTELKEAKAVAKTAESREVVDEAQQQLESAVQALVKKTTPKISLSSKSVTYNAKAQKIGVAKVTGSTGKVTYKYYSDAACTKAVSASKVKNAGTYYVKATVAATDNTKAATSKAARLVIKKAKATVKTKTTSKSYKASTLSKKAQSFTIGASANSKGKVTYKVTKKNSNISVSSSGKVTVKKGAKKGTYKVTVKITSAATTNYAAASKTVTLKVVVK